MARQKREEEYSFLLDVFSGILFHAIRLAEGETVRLEYRFDCPEFPQLRERYPIETVAGKGGDFERALRLCRWLAPRLRHKSDYDNHVPCNALALLDYCFEKSDTGINCLSKAKVLVECCLALGIYARRVGGMPCSPYDGDSHVVTEIFDRKRSKWVALDPTCGSYFSTGGEPLSCLELRDAFAEHRSVSAILNRQNPARIQELQKRNLDVNYYYAKNLFYFSLDTISAFGVPKENAAIFVVPEGFDLRRQQIKHLEYMASGYHMDMGEQIARTKEKHFRIGSPALWDRPGPESNPQRDA